MMSWNWRKAAVIATQEALEDFYGLHCEWFAVKVHVGGTFKLSPALEYVGGTFFNIDYCSIEMFDLKDVDELALRGGYSSGSSMLYAYKATEWGLFSGFKPLLSDQQLLEFKELVKTDRINLSMFIECDPSPDLQTHFIPNTPLRMLDLPVTATAVSMVQPDHLIHLSPIGAQLPLLADHAFDNPLHSPNPDQPLQQHDYVAIDTEAPKILDFYEICKQHYTEDVCQLIMQHEYAPKKLEFCEICELHYNDEECQLLMQGDKITQGSGARGTGLDKNGTLKVCNKTFKNTAGRGRKRRSRGNSRRRGGARFRYQPALIS